MMINNSASNLIYAFINRQCGNNLNQVVPKPEVIKLDSQKVITVNLMNF